jgi:enamine deaminase RidA (YjgF/YER057c/UK114 family)
VEWKSSLQTPVEIELVAWGGPASAVSPEIPADAEYITPPGFTQSPVYCRICRVPAGRMIFTSGLTGSSEASSDAEGEVHSAFARLASILDKTGSDMKHLVKATYYVSNDPVSAALNKVRPGYYDPQRPPAASKAMTEFVDGGLGLMMDMIAVPVH